jgi:hypothetical protein
MQLDPAENVMQKMYKKNQQMQKKHKEVQTSKEIPI